MTKTELGELIYSDLDIMDYVMQGRDIRELRDVQLDVDVDFEAIPDLPESVRTWRRHRPSDLTLQEFDRQNQQRWHMPQEYQDMDIAAHVLALCDSPEELQRAGQELLMFQQRDLFDLLKYLVYLVTVMRDNNIVWGVGRGSSVASFVLYKLGVHRINSLYYDLDPAQFLR